MRNHRPQFELRRGTSGTRVRGASRGLRWPWPVVLWLSIICVGAPSEAGEPPPAPKSDAAARIEALVARMDDPDVAAVAEAAGALIDLCRTPGLPPDLERSARLAVQARLNPEGRPPELLPALLRVLAEKGERFFDRDLVSLACRRDAGTFEAVLDVLGKARDGPVAGMFLELYRDLGNPPPVREKAVRALNHLKAWKALPDLVEARGDPAPEVAAAAQASLEGIAGFPYGKDAAGWRDWWSKASARPQADVLYESVRLLLRETLALLEPGSLTQNVKALKCGVRAVQEKALEHLGTLQDPASIPDLLAYVGTGPGGDLRVRAIALLGDLAAKEASTKGAGAPVVVRALLDLLPRESDPVLVRTGLRALSRVGRLEGIDLGPLLIGVLGSSDPALQAEAATAVGKIGGAEMKPAVEPLCALLARRNGTPDPRREAAWALGILGDPRAVPALVEGLGDPDANVRWNCANSLAGLGGTGAFEGLAQATTIEREDRVLEVLVKALRNLKDGRALPSLARLVLRRETLAEKASEAMIELAPADPAAAAEAAAILDKGGKPDAGLRLLVELVARAPLPENRQRLAEFQASRGKWEEAVGEYLSILKADPGGRDPLDRLLRTLCQIDDPARRGTLAARAAVALPSVAASVWGGLVRDLAGGIAGREAEVSDGLGRGFQGTAPADAFFLELAAFVLNPDGKVAAAAHRLLSVWTRVAADPLPEDARDGVKKLALAGWTDWWAAHKGEFPFRRPG